MKEYLVQPELQAERKAAYAKVKSINNKWTPVTSEEAHKEGGLNGNVNSEILIDKTTLKVREPLVRLSMFDKNKAAYAKQEETSTGIYMAISSALAMYRLICLFNNPIVETEGAAGYKVPWSMSFKHKKTGLIIMFSEWKGGFGVWTKFGSPKEVPELYKKDMIEIINLILSDKSPHPYDGCTAGSVA